VAAIQPLSAESLVGRAARWRSRHDRTLSAALLLAPGCLLFFVFVVHPIVQTVRLSLYEWDGTGPKTWIGLVNYSELAADPTFRTALANNLIWLACYGLAPILGLALALFLNQKFRGIRLARCLFLLPFVISQVVVGVVFAWFFNAHFGLFDRLTGAIGLGPLALLDNEDTAVFAVILAGLWPQTAYCMILYLAGLTAIRPELIDAARLDGAKGWTMLWHVVLPELRPVTFLVLLVCCVSALRNFDLVTIMTGGGPYNSSTVAAFYMYEQIFLGFRYGYGAAIATALFVLIELCVLFFLWRMLCSESE
jgi:multiple sugar transport system permease protein